MTEAAILLQLLRLPGVGPVNLRKILARLFQIGVPPERILELSDEQLALDIRLQPVQIAALRSPALDAEADLCHCADLGIRTLLPADPDYPLCLLSLLGRTAPPLLFARGNLELLRYPALGLSGSRKAGEASLAAVLDLSRAVAAQGWVVVSGGAPGADEVAHLATMPQGPGTIIVLPTGILKPKLRRELHKHLQEDQTLLLSEFPPEFGWTVGCAMQRNRLLAALSRVMVLVEPGPKGGTGGTGRIAARLGLPLYILQTDHAPGEAAQAFLAQGARSLHLDDINPVELIKQFMRAFEETEALRKSSMSQNLFPP